MITKPHIVSFRVDAAAGKAIAKIVKRATNLLPGLKPMEVGMDVTACHANGCPLRLEEMAVAPDTDFLYDVLGIRRHIDRKTGKLGGCFMPRFAVRQG